MGRGPFNLNVDHFRGQGQNLYPRHLPTAWLPLEKRNSWSWGAKGQSCRESASSPVVRSLEETDAVMWAFQPAHPLTPTPQLYPLKQACILSRVWLSATPWTVAYLAPLSRGFSRQEYWSGLTFPSPGDLPTSGMEPSFLASLAGGLFTTSATWDIGSWY